MAIKRISELDAETVLTAASEIIANRGGSTKRPTVQMLLDVLGAEGFALGDAPQARDNLGLASAAQGAKADTALQPADVGTAAAEDVGAFATAEQGARADLAGFDILEVVNVTTPVDAVEHDSFDPAIYGAYGCIMANAIPVADDVRFYLRTSSDGGLNYDAGASDYSYANDQLGAGNTGSSNSTVAIILTNVGVALDDVGSAAGEDGVSMEITIFGPHLAKKTLMSWKGAYLASNGNPISFAGSGGRLASENVNAVQITASSGQIESGLFIFFGKRMVI